MSANPYDDLLAQDDQHDAAGVLQPGNIDLAHRPVVRNSDGTISTVRSMGVNVDGREVLIPTVGEDGRILSENAAIDLYRRSGKHLGVFASPEASTAYAQRLHEQQAALYGDKAPANPYETLVAQDEAAERSQRAVVLRQAVKINPDQAAQAADVASKQGLPQDVALRNLPDALARQRVADAEHTLERNPVLADRMRYPPFAQMAHDSVDSLGAIEQVFREGAFAARALGSGLPAFSAGAYGLLEGVAGTIETAVGVNDGPISGTLRQIREGQQALTENVAGPMPADAGMLRRGIRSGIQSVGQQAPGLAASIATGNPAFSLMGAGVTTAGQSTSKAIDAGLSPAQSVVFGAADGAIEVATEKIPVARLLGDLKAGAPFLKTLMHQIVTEVPGEQIATAAQDFNEWATLHPDKPFSDYVKERPAAAVETLIATLVGTGVQSGASHALGKLAGVVEKRATEKEFTEQDMATLEGLLKLAENDKLRERSPQQFAQTVQAMADASLGAPKAVHIDANALVETLHQHGMAPAEIEQAFPSVAPHLADAVVSGGDVVVPVGEFVALTAGHEAQTALLDHVRLSEDTLSRAEQKAVGEMNLNAETEKLDAADARQQSVQAVRGTLLEQLNAVGRFSPAVNAAYADTAAAMYETQAARLGITAEELHARYPLNVTGESSALQALNQPAYHGTPHRGIDEFTTQAMGTGEGAQAYGWGLYFAQSKDIADFYRRTLARPQLAKDSQNPFAARVGKEITRLEKEHGQQALGREWLDAHFEKMAEPYGPDQEVGNAYLEMVHAGEMTFDGQLYEVEVPSDAEVLDYDAPLKDQPEKVRAALEKLGFPAEQFRVPLDNGATAGLWDTLDQARKALATAGSSGRIVRQANTRTGNQIYAALSMRLGGDEAASRALFAAGVPGMRFLDSNSRGVDADKQLRNYVVFDDSAVKKTREFYQGEAKSNKGTFTPQTNTLALLAKADLSTFHHELGHAYLEMMTDLAAQPDAPAAIVEDMQRTLQWFGVTDAAAWNALTFEQKEPYHEKFARGFEAFLFEGKAPSRELSGVFGRFAEWMRRVYRSIKALNVEINDDIRRVYDRMLASEDAINEMQQLRGMTAAGAAVKTLDSEATAEAVNDLQRRSLRDMQWLTNAKNRALKALQQKAAATRKVVEDQVRAVVERMPVYAAENFLRRGKLNIENPNNAQRRLIDETAGTNTKLDLATLKEMYGETPAAPWRYLATGKYGLATTKDGIHPDLAAEIFGFDSGDALVRALLAAEPQASVIEGMTDQRMLEEHGELSSPDALQRAAEAAVHNTARSKFIATELNAINKALGSVRVLMTAAKQYAEQVIGGKVIAEIRPKAYTAAESRYARLAEKALGKSVPDATNAKRNQLLNHYLAREALDAQDDITRIREFFRRVADTPDDRAGKSRDMDVVNAARAVLAAYGAGQRGQAATEYLKRVQAYDPDLSQTLQGAVDAALANAKPIDTLTLNELKALNDEVASLWHLAKRSHQVEIDGQLVSRESVQDALKERMQAIGIPDAVAGDASAITPGERRIGLMRSFRAAMRRVESWVDAMDGTTPGVGAFRRYVWQPVRDAADAYRVEKAKYLKAYRDLLKPIADMLNRRLIAAPELGYTFGKDNGVALSEILHAVLHTGNASNKRKLLLGRKWVTENEDGTLNTAKWDSFIKRMHDEGVLTKAHYDFVQGTWDLLEAMKPLAQKTHRDVFGKYFAEVTAEPVKTPFGDYRGGYVPALADSRIVPDADIRKLAEDENASLQFAFPATSRGFTKGRVDYNRPLLLDLGSIAQHIDKVLLFSHLEQPVRDVRRVLTAKGVAYGLNRIDPQAFGGILTPWLNRAAKQQVETPIAGAPGLMRFFSVLRARAGMAAMFANVSNAAQQITGFSIAAVKVPPHYMLGATADFLSAPRQTARAVSEASPYMRTRMDNEVAQMGSTIREILIDPSLLDKAQAWAHKHAYFMQSAVDNVMGPIIWNAAYRHAQDTLPPVDGTGRTPEQVQQALGARDRDAVRHADSVVRQTQGSTAPEDISRIETGNAFVRMFTQFAAYFNMQANLMGTEFGKLGGDLGLRKSAARGLYVLLLGFLVPAWMSELVVQAFRSGPDDDNKDGEYLDDWIKAVFGMSTLRGATAMLPGIGPVVNAAVNMTNKKPYDDRISTAPAISMLESAAHAAAVAVPHLLTGEELKARDVKDIATLISLTVGVPVNVAAKPLAYQLARDQGKANPTSPVDAARGYLTGANGPR